MNIIEYAIARKLAGGGSTPAVIEPLSVTANGLYTPPEGVDGYSPVTVSVASGSDEEWFNDGDTHIWISLNEGRTSPRLGVCPNGTVTVDWGDGTEPDTLTGTSTSSVKWTPNHEYAKAGDYIITLTVDGTVGFSGDSDNGTYLLRHTNTTDSINYAYRTAVKKLEAGESVTNIGIYAFSNCYSLTSVVIPNGVTYISAYAFSGCYSLTSVVIPNGVTNISDNAFSNCYSLTSVVIPNGVTYIGRSAFQNGYSLTSLTIPSGVTSIGTDVFFGCRGVRWYDFTTHTAVPALSGTSAFKNIPDDCEIRVPAALYDEWIAATNWSTYASHIVAV